MQQRILYGVILTNHELYVIGRGYELWGAPAPTP
jgi:hypothetical protein